MFVSYNYDEWKYKFEKYGIDGLKESRTLEEIFKELKLAAVNDYLSGKLFITMKLLENMKLSSRSVFRKMDKQV